SRRVGGCVGNLSTSLLFWIATANLLQLRWKERDNGSSGHTTKPVLITKCYLPPSPVMRIPKPRLLRAVMNPDSQYENYMSNKGPISAASEVLREGAAQVWGRGSSGTLRARVLSGSMIMLVSSGLVGAMNLVYNLAIAHGLGAAGFGHASAGYTVLVLLSSVTL